MRLWAAKVVAPMNRQNNANLYIKGDNLQAEPQARRFSRERDSAPRRVFVYRPKAREPKWSSAESVLTQQVRPKLSFVESVARAGASRDTLKPIVLPTASGGEMTRFEFRLEVRRR